MLKHSFFVLSSCTIIVYNTHFQYSLEGKTKTKLALPIQKRTKRARPSRPKGETKPEGVRGPPFLLSLFFFLASLLSNILQKQGEERSSHVLRISPPYLLYPRASKAATTTANRQSSSGAPIVSY